MRPWYVSAEGFRALRHSCFLSREACAKLLGVSVRTVRHWDAGRNRVPWSVVRLLRLRRRGDIGALHDAWAGWVLNERTAELVSPNGYSFQPGKLEVWPILCEQARFWRDDFRRRSAVERLQGASPGAAVQHPTGESLSCTALATADPVAETPPPATALFLLPVAAASIDPSVVAAAALALPALANAGVFLADPAILAAQFPALVQGQPSTIDSNLLSHYHQIGDFSPAGSGISHALGPDANRGQKTFPGES
ncbi:VC1465 family Xer recombination activation factor [Dyella terrae]|uniref:VC1465 family Xer recombination activation factor n=1 Tax=Dyella terrae TaxID=522259 RepID=UPI0023D93D82|nr:VC1465 family Xer recombination activation factor [Dyella terrae]ULU23789.1 Phage protein [Dyella terrae]